MKPLLRILALILRDQRPALVRGGALAIIVLLMGAALLGLSGWFITAAAAAGLAGTGAVFDVFRPSAMVRFLALARTAARYGERVLTHDATLRSLTALRVRLLERLVRARYETLLRLRAGTALNRVTSDVDALDALPLRLVIPAVAAVATLAVALLALWWLVHPLVALTVALGLAGGAAVVLFIGMRAALGPSRRAEAAAQAVRSRLVDLIAARSDLAVYGQLGPVTESVHGAVRRFHCETRRLAAIERRAGAAFALLAAMVTAGALWIGGDLALSGELSAAAAGIGVFVALALFEVIAPFRRTLAEQGRMMQAARRVTRMLDADPEKDETVEAGEVPVGVLDLEGIVFRRNPEGKAILNGFDLHVKPGEMVALTGSSGSGKSTLLLIAAGCFLPEQGHVRIGETSLDRLAAKDRRRAVTLVPQRSSLLQGTIAENLRMAAPEATDGELESALAAVSLDRVVAAKGGLSARLGPRGSGLSGGEARRLVLARALLPKPSVLLLDEPTEGLDDSTARQVLHRLRAALPDSAILIAAHREVEREAADRIATLQKSEFQIQVLI